MDRRLRSSQVASELVGVAGFETGGLFVPKQFRAVDPGRMESNGEPLTSRNALKGSAVAGWGLSPLAPNLAPVASVDGTFIWIASNDQRLCSLSTVSYAVAIPARPTTAVQARRRSEASTTWAAAQNTGGQLDPPAGGCEDGAVVIITEGDRTPLGRSPSFGADYGRLMTERSRSTALCRASSSGLANVSLATAVRSGSQGSSWLGASKPIRHKPVEAHMLFGSVADKTAVNLCRNTHHEPARIGAF